MKKISYLLLIMFAFELKSAALFNNFCRRRPKSYDTNPVAVYHDHDLEAEQGHDENPQAPSSLVGEPSRMRVSFLHSLDSEIADCQRAYGKALIATSAVWGAIVMYNMFTNALND